MSVDSVKAATFGVLLAASLAVGGCDFSRSDEQANEVRLQDAGLSVGIPDGFKLADERRIVDADGDVSLFYTFTDVQAAETGQIRLSISRDDEGVASYFDPRRSLDEQLKEEEDVLSLAGYEVVKSELRTIDGRDALEIKARDSTEGIFRAFVPMGVNGSVSVLGAAESNSSRQELLFDTVLATLQIE